MRGRSRPRPPLFSSASATSRRRPKNPDGSFESVVIEFDARGELAGMELVDTFSQRTTLVFGEIVRERMDPASFRLEIPEGTDVVKSAF